MAIFRRPANAAAAGDPIPFFDGRDTHLFYLSSPSDTVDYPTRVRTTWQHARTKDLVEWQHLKPAVEPGPEGAYDGGGIWTGSVVEKDGTYHLFYTGHHVGAPNPQTICLATSTDLEHFERHERNPLIAPPSGFEPVDWRDPYVFYNEAERCWWMLIAARLAKGPRWRRGCIALATSQDLLAWTVDPKPLYVPGTTYCPECPEMWQMGGRWYLVFSRFSEDVGTIYRVAATPRGPFRVPEDEALGGRRWYAAKSAPQPDGSRIFFGWVHDFVAGDRPRWLWGGDFTAPRVVTAASDGALRVALHPSLGAGFEDGVAHHSTLEAVGGEARTAPTGSLPKTVLIKAVIAVEDEPASFGVALVENDDCEGWFITFDRSRGSVTLTREPRPLDDFWADLTGRDADYRNVDGPVLAEANYDRGTLEHRLAVLLDRDVLEVYIDDRKALSHRIGRTRDLRATTFVVDGRATVDLAVAVPR